jgi:peptidoglycan hydrolase CwlO-like protein
MPEPIIVTIAAIISGLATLATSFYQWAVSHDLERHIPGIEKQLGSIANELKRLDEQFRQFAIELQKHSENVDKRLEEIRKENRDLQTKLHRLTAIAYAGVALGIVALAIVLWRTF